MAEGVEVVRIVRSVHSRVTADRLADGTRVAGRLAVSVAFAKVRVASSSLVVRSIVVVGMRRVPHRASAGWGEELQSDVVRVAE